MNTVRLQIRHLVDWKAAVYAGIIAGALFLLALLVGYPLATGGTPWTVFRFIGAMVLGRSVLPPPTTFDAGVVITAVLLTHAPGDRLPDLLRAIFDLLTGEQEFWGSLYTLRTQPAITAVIGDDFLQRTALLRGCFSEELALAGNENPELEAYYLYSVVEGAIQQYLLDPANYPMAEILEKMIAQFGGKHT